MMLLSQLGRTFKLWQKIFGDDGRQNTYINCKNAKSGMNNLEISRLETWSKSKMRLHATNGLVVRRTCENQDGLVRKVEIAVLKNGTPVLCVRPIAELVLLLEVDK